MRIAAGVFLIVLSSTFAWPSTLTLGSGSSVPGASMTIPVSLSSGSSVSAVEWTLNYSTTDIASMQIVAPSSLAAGKQLVCRAPVAGRYVCLVSGLDQKGIPDGVVANAVLTIASNITSTSSNLSVGAPSASNPDGSASIINAIGSTVTITQGGATLSGLTCTPATISVAGSASCTVTLSKSAPSGGTVVTLGYRATGATMSVPASVTVPAGSSQQSFIVQAVSASGSTNATVTAILNSTTLNYTLAVTPASTTPVTLSGLTCSPSSITAPGSAGCTATLSDLAPIGGTIVSLSYKSTGSTISIPASVTVPAGSRQQSFTAQALTATGSTTATVSATLNGNTSTYTLSVAPGTTAPVTVSSLQCSPWRLTTPEWTDCTLTLSGHAPSGGSIVSLSYKSTGATMSIPTNVTVPAGSTQCLFHVKGESAQYSTTATLYATLNGKTSSYTLALAP